MKSAGIAQLNNRVAFRFDRADKIMVLQKDKKGKIFFYEILLTESNPIRRVQQIVSLGINTFICGAMSRFVCHMFQHHGIEVIGGVAGDTPDIIEQFLQGTLQKEMDIYSPGEEG